MPFEEDTEQWKRANKVYDRPMYYLLDEQNNPYPTDDGHAANALLIAADRRRVGLTEKTVAGHDIMVSTVFLVIDHNHSLEGSPVLYETMLFIDWDAIESATQRYETRGQAQEGHQAVSEGVEQVLMQIGEHNLETVDIVRLLEGEQS